MAVSTALRIATEIKAYMDSRGGNCPRWYVGIAADAHSRLFVDHGVNQYTDAWIWRPAQNADEARRIEAYFHKTLGCDGGPGGGDYTTTHVYAYLKNSHTLYR